jgi:hypothetical protein
MWGCTYVHVCGDGMYVCGVYVCVWGHMYEYICRDLFMNVRMCRGVGVYVCLWGVCTVHMYVCGGVCTNVCGGVPCMYVCGDVCTCVGMYACVWECIYIYAHVDERKLGA